MVGTPRTRHWAMSCLASGPGSLLMSTLTSLKGRRASCTMGSGKVSASICRQGAHQEAEKSTSTGCPSLAAWLKTAGV